MGTIRIFDGLLISSAFYLSPFIHRPSLNKYRIPVTMTAAAKAI